MAVKKKQNTSESNASLYAKTLLFLQSLPAIWALLYILPIYHPLYRFPLNILSYLVILSFPLSSVIGVVYVLFRRKVWLIVAFIAVSALSILLFRYFGDMRRYMTQKILDAAWCGPTAPRTGIVLGGILKEGDSFMNDTHCMLTVCEEEFFRCTQD